MWSSIRPALSGGICSGRQTEFVALLAAADRVLAEPVVADRDLPPFPRSTRDGYAVRSADLSQLPATLEVIGEIKAGETLDEIPANIGTGQTVSIMTGAPVPAGADAVVMVEYTSPHGQQVEITRSVAPGENIVARGAEARKARCLLDRGLRLNERRSRWRPRWENRDCKCISARELRC